jgi:hypothetical protein
MPAHFGQIVYTSFAEAGFQCVTSAWLPPSILQSFEQEIVHCYWDAYDPPEKGFRGVYVHQVTVDQCLFGWVYSDLLDELGRCHVPYFHSYYLDELLHPALLESIFIFLQKGPVAIVSQDSLPTHLETITAPDLWTYQPARAGISIPFELRKRCHDNLQRWKPINIFTSVNVVEEHQPQNERVPLLTYSQQQVSHSNPSETLEIVVPQRYVDLVPKRKSVLQRLEVALFGQNETQTAPDPWTSINNGADSDYASIPEYEHEFELEKRPSWAVPRFNIAPQLWLKGFSVVGVAVAMLGAIYYGQPLGQIVMNGIEGIQWPKSPQQPSQNTAEQRDSEQLNKQPKPTQSRINLPSQPLASPSQGGALTAPQSSVVPPAPANQLPMFQPLPPLESPALAPLPLSTPFPNPPAAGRPSRPTYGSQGQTTAAKTRPQAPQVQRSPNPSSIPDSISPPTQDAPPSAASSFPVVSPAAAPPSSDSGPPPASPEVSVPSAAAIAPPRADAETEPPLPPVAIEKPAEQAVPPATSKPAPIKTPEKPVAASLDPAPQPNATVMPPPAAKSKTPVLPAPRSWSEPAPTAP